MSKFTTTITRGIAMPVVADAAVFAAAYATDAKALVCTWQSKKHAAIRTNRHLGLTAWSPPL